MGLFPGALPSAGSASASDTLATAGHTSLHNTGADETRALATKIGTGSSTPTSGTLLRSTGVGTSSWAQAVLTSDVTGVLPVANGGTGGASAPAAAANLAAEVGKLLFPIGCIYTETTGTNPGTSLGFGTWAAFGAGQVLVGNGTSDQVFAAGATGGESSHTLTSTEMPSHTHTQNSHTHNWLSGNATATGGGTTGVALNNAGFNNSAPTDSTTATNQNTGGGATHNNLQPYIVVYFWKRTA